jgi:ABC-type nickel/cobalt efflux system permease component RcnA
MMHESVSETRKRKRGRLWLASFLSLCLLGGIPALAHPIPKDNHDRTIAVWLVDSAVVVYYTLEVDEGRAAQDLRREEFVGVTSQEQLYQVFTRTQAPILAGNLDARLDGKTLTFTCDKQEFEIQPQGHLVCNYVFRAPFSLEPGRPAPFTFRENNYFNDDFSRLELTLAAGAAVRLSDVTAPDEALRKRPPTQRKSGDGTRLRRLAATVTRVLGGDGSRAEYKPAPPQDPEPPRTKPRRKAIVAVAKPAATAADVAEAKSGGEPAAARRAEDSHRNLLHLLLDTRTGFAMLLLAAVGLGAAHALTPGHGKTLVAAYLVGERGTVWHALLLGLVTTLTHTGIVLTLAAVGYFFPEAVPGAVRATQLIGGLAIALLGCWLLLRRLSGQADHFHLPGHGHHHHHGHGHSHTHELPQPKPGTRVGWWHLVVLGMQGGIVPCWDAIFILSVAWTTGRLARALPLLLAFSAGLAAVLVGLGISVVVAHRWVGARWGNHPRLRRLAGALPLLSATVILGMGLWLCYDSVHASEISDTTESVLQRPIK